MLKKLSIIIPTKDRYDTLSLVVSSILEYVPTHDLEIVISDNSTKTRVIENLWSDKDPDVVVYSHFSGPLSMVENTERALSMATGKFLLFIGDDDFVSPYIMEIIDLMEENNVDSLVYPIANYFYETVEFNKKYAFNNPSTLQIIKNPNLELNKRFSSVELDKVCESGAIFIGGLPRLYHGIISRTLLDNIVERFHKSVPGPCPDMTLSMALAKTIDEYYFINYPVSVSGASSASEGGKGPTKKHVVRLEDKQWLNQNDIHDWDNHLPRIFSRETIWAQCVYHVLNISGDPRRINYVKLYSSMLVNCPQGVLDETLPLYHFYLKSNRLSQNTIVKDFVTRYIKKMVFSVPSFVLELLVFLRGDYKKMRCVKGLRTVNDCMEFLKNDYPIK